MQYKIFFLISILFIITGCNFLPSSQVKNQNSDELTIEDVEQDLLVDQNSMVNYLEETEDAVVIENKIKDEVAEIKQKNYYYPIANYSTMRTVKTFGQYISPESGDRFSGYHTGDDIEVKDINKEVPVYALTNSTLVRTQFVSGFGGVIILEFEDENENNEMVTYHALYGHVDLNSITHQVGDEISKGEQIALLGDNESEETDGERKHLHFGIYQYVSTERFTGYIQDQYDLILWKNPYFFLLEHNAVNNPVGVVQDNIENNSISDNDSEENVIITE